ncbi:hypothetical protein B0J12DRAFT_284631 [Macrophomina phaseolina]|uniref:Uncharacterized protein n=1 Tax=Macrophomina phaseolina TaxID=35725 RepID=A0ABQ8GR86_9PEZI|nr:hypothetical protein B0J12DRAFT_284631 [Macrophomina phaseolina]
MSAAFQPATSPAACGPAFTVPVPASGSSPQPHCWTTSPCPPCRGRLIPALWIRLPPALRPRRQAACRHNSRTWPTQQLDGRLLWSSANRCQCAFPAPSPPACAAASVEQLGGSGSTSACAWTSAHLSSASSRRRGSRCRTAALEACSPLTFAEGALSITACPGRWVSQNGRFPASRYPDLAIDARKALPSWSLPGAMHLIASQCSAAAACQAISRRLQYLSICLSCHCISSLTSNGVPTRHVLNQYCTTMWARRHPMPSSSRTTSAISPAPENARSWEMVFPAISHPQGRPSHSAVCDCKRPNRLLTCGEGSGF